MSGSRSSSAIFLQQYIKWENVWCGTGSSVLTTPYQMGLPAHIRLIYGDPWSSGSRSHTISLKKSCMPDLSYHECPIDYTTFKHSVASYTPTHSLSVSIAIYLLWSVSCTVYFILQTLAQKPQVTIVSTNLETDSTSTLSSEKTPPSDMSLVVIVAIVAATLLLLAIFILIFTLAVCCFLYNRNKKILNQSTLTSQEKS